MTRLAHSPVPTRRRLLAGAAGALASVGRADAQGRTAFRVQYDWLMDNGKIGDVVALKRGYFEAEGIALTVSPGGPNAQTVPPVLAGQAQAGQMGSNQVLAACGEGIPLRMVATTYQNAPLVFISLPRAPVRSPADLPGKTVAVTPNGRWLVNLMLSANRIDPAAVRLVTLGADLSPLLLGQADVAVGFSTNTQALAAIGPGRILMTAEEAGIPYYTNTYFVSADDYERNKDAVARFVRAVARGWGWAFENRRAAVDLLCDAYPNLDRAIEHATVDTVMGLAFGADTRVNGWGWIDPGRMQREIDMFAAGGGFRRRTPVLADALTREVLDMTGADRPRLG